MRRIEFVFTKIYCILFKTIYLPNHIKNMVLNVIPFYNKKKQQQCTEFGSCFIASSINNLEPA